MKKKSSTNNNMYITIITPKITSNVLLARRKKEDKRNHKTFALNCTQVKLLSIVLNIYNLPFCRILLIVVKLDWMLKFLMGLLYLMEFV